MEVEVTRDNKTDRVIEINLTAQVFGDEVFLGAIERMLCNGEPLNIETKSEKWQFDWSRDPDQKDE